MKKKLGTLITLGAVALVAMAIIILYFAPVSYMPALTAPGHIIVYQSQSTSATLTANQETYNKVWAEYQNSFKQNMLSAIFAGQTNGVQNQTLSGELRTTQNAPNFSTYLVFNYDTAQSIVVSGHKQNVLIDQVQIEVENEVGYTNTTVYFRQVSDPNEKKTYYFMTTLANQNSLYKLITGLDI